MIPTHKITKIFDKYPKGTTLTVVESFRGAYWVRGYRLKELYSVSARGVQRVFSTEREAQEFIAAHLAGKRGVLRRVPCLVLIR